MMYNTGLDDLIIHQVRFVMSYDLLAAALKGSKWALAVFTS